MDFLIEAIGELLGAVFEGVTESERVPKPVRAAVTVLLFAPLIVLLVLAAVLLTERAAFRAFFAAVALVFAFGLYKTLRKIFK